MYLQALDNLHIIGSLILFKLALAEDQETGKLGMANPFNTELEIVTKVVRPTHNGV
jgi:hypothetical protein